MFGKSRWMKIMENKVWQMNRSTKRLLIIVITNMDDFSLVNHR